MRRLGDADKLLGGAVMAGANGARQAFRVLYTHTEEISEALCAVPQQFSW